MFSVTESIRTRASENALAPAVITASGYLSYFELVDRVARISNYLSDRDVPRGAKIFINVGSPDLRLLVTIACLHCGLVPIVSPDPKELGDGIAPDFVVGAPQLFGPEPQPDLLIDQTILEGRLADHVLRDFPDRADDDILFIATTSGTTGQHKVVAEKYGGYKRRQERSDRPGRGDRVLFTIGDVSRYGLTNSLRLLDAGAAIVRNVVDQAACLTVTNVFGVTHLLTTPKWIETLLDVMELHHIRCPSVRQIEITGSLFPEALIRRVEAFFDAEIVISYGTAEVGVISRGKVTSETFQKGYVGDLLPGLKLTSEGDETNPGTLTFTNEKRVFVDNYVKGELVRNDATTFSIPDIGYVNGDSVYLLGRSDETYNFSGTIIAYSVIEDAVRALAEVADVGVVSLASLGDPNGLAIAVVSGKSLDLRQLAEAVARRFQMPVAAKDFHFFATPTIERNAMGKIDRQALLTDYQNRTSSQTSLAG